MSGSDALPIAAAFATSILAVVVLFLIITTYNDVVALGLRIDKAWSNIDVVLRQRFDQLPALVDAVRGVMAFEREVLEDVARWRAGYAPSDPVPRQAATSAGTTEAVRRLLAVVERYPELSSATNVLALQASIARLEDQIADRRELYNDQVRRYDTRIATLPGLLLAPLFGWRARAYFEAGPEARATPPGLGDLPGT